MFMLSPFVELFCSFCLEGLDDVHSHPRVGNDTRCSPNHAPGDWDFVAMAPSDRYFWPAAADRATSVACHER
jgi:hypothetical protein